MALRVYRVGEYEKRAEQEQFEAIYDMLYRLYGGEGKECLLVGNYELGGVNLDALMVVEQGFYLLEFKNWGGAIVARENGSWTSEGRIIQGGAGSKNPFQQIRINRSRGRARLMELLGWGNVPVRGIISFLQADAEVDCEGLSSNTKEWLRVIAQRDFEGEVEHIRGKQGVMQMGVLELEGALGLGEFRLDRDGVVLPQSQQAAERRARAIAWYRRLLPLALGERGLAEGYDVVYSILREVLVMQTKGLREAFASDAARLLHLCQELGLKSKNRGLHRRIRSVGARIHRKRGGEGLSEEGLGYDIRAVAEFIYLCAEEPILPALLAKLPKGAYPAEQHKQVARDYMRVSVLSWSEDEVEVEEVDGEPLRLPLRFQLSETWALDYSYLTEVLWPSAQLNLIRPRFEEGAVLPEQVILEPDYLVNISVVAKVFQAYGTSELNLLIDRFTPQELSGPLLLGNLSGMLLDRVIYSEDGSPKYIDVVRDFFSENPLGISTCAELQDEVKSEEFHRNALHQLEYLKRIFRGEEHGEGGGGKRVIDLEQVVLEPSFICEQLGLQGRMDLIQEDMRVLMEQKSGRWDGFHGTVNGQGKPYESHYVQMLLYMAVLRYGMADRGLRNEDIASYLLYSRYPNGLLRESPATTLLQRAFEMRNRIVWQDYALARGEGLDLLLGLRSEALHRKSCGHLWEGFIQPKVERVLGAMQKANAAEQAYAGHAITFIARELQLAKVGNPEREGSGHAAVWCNSNDEKRDQGNLLDALTIAELARGERGEDREGVHDISLRIPERESTALPNFRLGDPVILYAYARGSEPDPRRDMVHKGAVLRFTAHSITVRLNARQRNRHLFEGERLWAIEHDLLEAGFAGQYRGICSFLEAPKERRELILHQRAPRRDAGRQPQGDYPGFNELMRKVVQARDYFLLIGPPGTGKTSKGLVNILREELTDPEARVLLLAYTNRAVDEICSKLEELKREYGAEAFRYMRLGRSLSTADAYRPFLMQELTGECRNRQEILELFGRIRIYTSTVTSLCSNLELFKLHSFSLAIVDEASQLLEPSLLPLLSAKDKEGESSISRFVFIGDEKQLPAVVSQGGRDSRLTSPALACLGNGPNDGEGTLDFRMSIFERLLRQEPADSAIVHRFTRQGRMHPEVAAFPSRSFYDGRLEAIPLAHQQGDLPYRGQGDDRLSRLLAEHRMLFFGVCNGQQMPSDKVNPAEGEAIARIAVAVYHLYQQSGRTFVAEESLGVIVPYRHQIATVRSELEKLGIEDLTGITIDTVERYQGSQRDVIIYGFTVQYDYQLQFLFESRILDRETGDIVDRKLNVALTRAKEQMVLVGNPYLLASDSLCERLIEHVRDEGGYYEWGSLDGGPGLNYAEDDADQGIESEPSAPVEGEIAARATEGAQGEAEQEARDSRWPKVENARIAVHEVQMASEGLAAAYKSQVIGTIAKDSRSDLGQRVILGYDRKGLKHAIGYGRGLYAQEGAENEGGLSPMDRVLGYAFTFMQAHYFVQRWVVEQHAALFERWLADYGCVEVVDVGCGPGVGGFAYMDTLLEAGGAICYHGYDPSGAARELGQRMLGRQPYKAMPTQWVDSLEALRLNGGLPVVFNFGMVFSSVDSAEANRWAELIAQWRSGHPERPLAVAIVNTPYERQLPQVLDFLAKVQGECYVAQHLTAGHVEFSYRGEDRHGFDFLYLLVAL